MSLALTAADEDRVCRAAFLELALHLGRPGGAVLDFGCGPASMRASTPIWAGACTPTTSTRRCARYRARHLRARHRGAATAAGGVQLPGIPRYVLGTVSTGGTHYRELRTAQPGTGSGPHCSAASPRCSSRRAGCCVSILNPWHRGDLQYSWWWRGLPQLLWQGRYSVPGAQSPIHALAAGPPGARSRRRLCARCDPCTAGTGPGRRAPRRTRITGGLAGHRRVALPVSHACAAGSQREAPRPRAPRPLALWSPIGLDSSQSLIDVSLEAEGLERDVTDRQVVAVTRAAGDRRCACARARHGTSVAALSRSRARHRTRSAAAERRRSHRRCGDFLDCFSVDASRHRCLPAPLRTWQRWLQSQRPRDERGGFSMSAADVQHLLVFLHLPAARGAGVGRRRRMRKPLSHGPGGHHGWRTLHAGVAQYQPVSGDAAQGGPRRARGCAPGGSGARVFTGRAPPAEEDRLVDTALRHDSVATLRLAGTGADATRSRARHHCRAGAWLAHYLPVPHHLWKKSAPACRALFHTSGIHRAWRRGHGARPWREPS